MNIPLVDLKAQYQSIKSEINAAIAKIVENAAFIGGKAVEEFEGGFAEFCGAKYCIGVGNGTDALIIALKCMGIGKGDEVIVPANSFIATSEAVTASGARVVFCDVDPDRYTINPDLIEEKISKKTRAIIPVHLYGCPADMDPIDEIAKKYNLFVLEDAAQAHGAVYKGRKTGTLGDAACFSFYPGKNLGAYGDGGAVVTNHEELAKKIRMMKNHGRIGKYDHEFEGVNSRLDGLQAAILNVKLKYLQDWSEARLGHARRYNELLGGITKIICPQIPSDSSPVFHLYVIRTKKRDALQQHLKEKDISTGIHYPIALPNLAAYRYLGHQSEDFPVASKYQDTILSLPMYAELTDEILKKVTVELKMFFGSIGNSHH